MDGDGGGLAFGEELMDFAGAGERDGGGEEVFACAYVVYEDALVNGTKRE